MLGVMTTRRRARAMTLRLTEAEWLAVHDRAARATMSLSEYARLALLGGKAQPAPTPQAPTIVERPRVPSRYLSSSDGDDAA